MQHLNKLISKELVIGLPKKKFEKDKLCVACQKGKQVKQSFHSKNRISTSKPLELLQMDLFGPSRIKSFGKITMLLLLLMITQDILGLSFSH